MRRDDASKKVCIQPVSVFAVCLQCITVDTAKKKNYSCLIVGQSLRTRLKDNLASLSNEGPSQEHHLF